jgi:5'-3' exonuclease
VKGSVPYDQYGLVVIVDYMNLLVKAWHAGAPSKIHAVKSLLLTVANIIERLSPEYIIFAADGGHAERSALYPAYKAHRPPKPPELVEQIELGERAIAAIGWPMIRVNDWEADDVIASLATQVANRAAGCLVCSCDKDLLQLLDGSLRVKIYHPWDQGKHLSGSHVEEKYGVRRHQFSEYLALVGDASDGVPGVTGIGPKKAAELLGKHEDLDEILEEARLLKIIGSAGKHLREQADQARLSAKLIELNCELTIPNTWHDFPATLPAAGWVDALRAIDLGAVVQRLGELLPMVGRVRLCSSLIEVIHDPAKAEKSPATLRRDLGNDPETHTGDSDSKRRPGPSAACPTDPVAASTSGNCHVASGELQEKGGQGVEFLSGGIPPRPNHGESDSRDEFAWVLDFPPFLNLRPNVGRETCLRAVYSDAYRFFLRGLSPATPQILSDYRQAWDLGITGKPFVLPPRPRLLTGDTAEDPPSPPYIIPQRRDIERTTQTHPLSPVESRDKSTLF